MIENPAKFNKMAAFFAACAAALVALNALSVGFLDLIDTFKNITYYFKDFGRLVNQLMYTTGYFFNIVSAVAVVLVLLRGKKDLIAAIALVLDVAVSILIFLPTYLFEVLGVITEGGFSFGLVVEVLLYFVGLLGLIIFRGVLAYSCFTKGKFPGEKLSWLPIAAVGLYIVITFLTRGDIPFFFDILKYNGFMEALCSSFYYSLSPITAMELIAAVFLGFAFWIPCTEPAEVPAEASAEN